MITYKEAISIINKSAIVLDVEHVSIFDSLGRILAENIISDINMPPFNKSAVDGFACKKEDLKNNLTQIEIISAGKVPQKKVEKNQCSKIMTGAIVPEGADCVIMIEDTEQLANNQIIFKKEFINPNIAYAAEDINIGDKLLDIGRLVKSQDVAIFASLGYNEVKVYKKPRVGILSTGDELVEPFVKPALSQIRNSNAYQIFVQILNSNSIPKYCGIALDNEKNITQLIEKSVLNNDVTILTGGVSMGDYDYVPDVLKKLGFEILVHNIAIQPGKPTLFAKNNNKYVFGLPGNPVSSFVIFEIIVKSFLYKLMSANFEYFESKYILGVDYKRRRNDRLSWIPVLIDNEGYVFPIEYHGSAHINSLSNANGILPVPIGTTEIKKGEKVSVRQL